MHRTIAALLATAAFAAPAAAQTVLGLAGDRTLVMIDPATATVTGTVEVQGADRLLGIDWRPGKGTLVGVTDTQAIVTIDPMTGATAPLGQMTTLLPVAGEAPVIVEINPAADRLRFMSGLVNHRVNMDTGEVTVDGMLAWEAGDANAAATPMVVATAYINAYGKPETTAMYNIDAGLSALLQQVKPNEGINRTIGALGVTLQGPGAFDVATDAAGTNTAWMAAMGGLHRLDLATGKVTESRPITGAAEGLRDLTVLPAM